MRREWVGNVKDGQVNEKWEKVQLHSRIIGWESWCVKWGDWRLMKGRWINLSKQVGLLEEWQVWCKELVSLEKGKKSLGNKQHGNNMRLSTVRLTGGLISLSRIRWSLRLVYVQWVYKIKRGESLLSTRYLSDMNLVPEALGWPCP